MLKKWMALIVAVCLLLCGCTPVGDEEENTTTASQNETTGQDMAAEDALGEGESVPTQGAVSDETKPKEPDATQPTGEPVPPDAPTGTTTPSQSTEPPVEESTTPTASDDSIELPDDDWT